MGLRKDEQARFEGMAYALKVAKEKGIDGLEAELKWRGITECPVRVPQSAVTEFCDRVRTACVGTLTLMSAMVLHDEFDFGEVRLKKFVKRYNDKIACLGDDLVTWQDMQRTLEEECGMRFDIHLNDENVRI